MSRIAPAELKRLGSVWGPAVGVMAAIFWGSGMSAPPIPSSLPDLGAHSIAYAGLGAAFVRGLANAEWHRVTTRTAVAAVVLAVGYGVTDEFHQSFVPGRTPELRDLVADGCGALIGAGAIRAWSIVLADR